MKRNVVFIDDEKDLCDCYELLFRDENLSINAFDHPKEAVDFINTHQVDICFIDFRMPEESGIQVREKIPENIPCVLVTGELDIKLPKGFIAQIEKPMRETDFKAAIDQYIKRV